MDSAVANIRRRFEADGHATSPLINPIDVERVRTEDWQIRRYLVDLDGNAEEAYQALVRTLQWKERHHVHSLKDTDFPTEFYALYKVESYGADKDGYAILAESYRHQRHWEEINQVFVDLVTAHIEKMDRIVGEKGMNYMADFSDTPVTKLDFSLATYRVNILNKHYPMLARRIMLHNVPKMVKPAMKLVVAFMKPSIRDTVVYTTDDDVTAFISPDILHSDFKGKRTERHYPVTESMRGPAFAAKWKVEPKFIDSFFKYNHLV
ncbi:Motile sperm domain-containing protein 2 [Tyrophagus putrescentiae]|nr:Motile sperm domain-containing protein 2 [Tyrophagus putrescentiae]